MNPTAISQQLGTLADVVEPADPNAADRMRNLAGAVTGGPFAEAWAESDVHDLIEPDSIVEQYRNQMAPNQWIGIIEWLRNSLVLTPVLVTWIGIAWAVDHYHTLLQNRPELSTQPFLLLWEDGFAGATALTLSRLAFIDGILLFSVLFLTVIAYALARSTDKKEEQVQALRTELNQALASASLVLKQNQSGQPRTYINQFEQMARKLLSEIEQERQRISQLAAKKEKELGDFTKFTAGLIQGAQEMKTSVQMLHQVHKDMINSINTLSTPITQLSNQQKDLLKISQQAGNQVKALLTTQRALQDQQKDLLQSIQHSVTELQKIVNLQASAGQDLRNAIDASNQSTRQTSQTAFDIAAIARDLASNQAQLIQALNNERTAQEQLAKLVSQSTMGLEGVTDNMKDISIHFRSMAGDLAQLVPILHTIPNNLPNVTQQYYQAAAQLANTSQSLQMAAQNLDQSLRNTNSRRP